MEKKRGLLTWRECERRILSHVSYEVHGTDVYIAKRKYGVNSLHIQALIVQFLGMMLLFMGIMNIISGGSVIGWISCVIAVLAFFMGMVYKMIVKEARKIMKNNK